MLVVARSMPPARRIESKLFRAVVPPAQFPVERVNIILSVLAIRLIGTHAEGVESRISIPPQLESLNRTDPLHLAEAICATMDVCPNDVDVIEINQVLSAQISLKLNRALDCREFVSDRDVLVMYTNTLVRCVPNPVRFLKREISFHVRRVIVRAMARVEGMRIYIGGCVGGH